MARIGRRWREAGAWVVLLAVLTACGQPRYPTRSPRPVSTTAVTPTTTHTSSTSSTRGAVPTVTICGHGPAVRPRRVVLACADYNDMVKDVSWTSWTAATATGHGTEWWNDCVPRSRCGLNRHRRARVVLDRVVDRQFTRMTVYAGGHVAAYELPD